jgi:hypothetical protein
MEADKRLINLAIGGYVLVEVVVIIYVCVQIARGY